MAFLDNSGDIILDAVLTDAGRARLAQGDGSFKIVKYAFGDDEVDYSKYRNANNVNGAHPSGSAYYDIDILRSPVLEAFTNNTSTMKNKLISIPRANLLFLPILKLNDVSGNALKLNGESGQASGSFVVTCDDRTDDRFFVQFDGDQRVGMLKGFNPQNNTGIMIDQGLDTDSLSKNQLIDSTLRETQFIIEMDNRLGALATPDGAVISYNFLDDDNIATYNLTTSGVGASFMSTISPNQNDSPLAGPPGIRFRFQIRPSLELQTGNYLFTRLGKTKTTWTPGTFGGPGVTFSHIDTTVRITGATTGYRMDVPVRYIKQDD